MQAPDWLKKCHPNSYLNARDFAGLLGLKRETFDARIRRGVIPQPTLRLNAAFGHNREWRVGDLLKNFFKDET